MNITFPQAKFQDLNNFSIKKSNRFKKQNKASKLPSEKEFMDFYNSGETRPKYIAKHFGISITQVREYLRKYCPYESIRPEKIPYNAKLNIQELKEFIENNPQLTCSEIAQHFGVVTSSVYRAIMLNDIDYIPKESSIKSHKNS